MPKERSIAIIKANFVFDPRPAVERYPGPTLVVTTSSSNQLYDLQILAPAIVRKVVAGTSHWLQMDKPDEFNRILDEFLKGTR